MDYTALFSETGKNRKPNLISILALAYNKNPSSIFLAGGMPNTRTFPYKQIDVDFEDGNRFVLKDDDLDIALQYGPAKGYFPLIAWWKDFQTRWHSPKYENWDVHFSAGSQDACSKIFDLFLNPNDPVMVQIPAYTATLRALFHIKPEVIEIEQDADGINPETIETILAKRAADKKPMPKLLYVNPVGANPTGTVLPLERKKKIYELAQKYNFIILEDDPYFFLHFLDQDPISFLNLDVDGRVIRFDSFSKVLSAGIRLGVVTAHKDILQKMSLHVQCTTLQACSLSQVMVYKTLTTWGEERYDVHFKHIQSFYRSRRDLLVNALNTHLTGLAEWTVPKGGLFVWVKITALDDVYNFVMEKCVDQGLLVLPGNAFSVNMDSKSPFIRICYSHATSVAMDAGLSILATLIKEEVKRLSSA